MSIRSEIDRLMGIKADLKAAINGSGSTVGDVFADYPPAVSNGRAGIAAAITEKGVQTPADAPFDVLQANVRAIQLSGGGLGECLGVFHTVGGVIDELVTFGNKGFSGMVAVSDAFTCTAVGSLGVLVDINNWVSNVYSSSLTLPNDGWLTFERESGVHRMNWVISPDGSLSDQAFTLYGLV